MKKEQKDYWSEPRRRRSDCEEEPRHITTLMILSVSIMIVAAWSILWFWAGYSTGMNDCL